MSPTRATLICKDSVIENKFYKVRNINSGIKVIMESKLYLVKWIS